MDLDTTLQDICRENAAALEFCRALHNLLHLIDDLVDRDNERSADDVAVILTRALAVFSCNEFFQQQRGALLPLLHTAFLSWRDSERLAKTGDPWDYTVSQVIKSAYQDVYFMVAFLVGGFGHQLAMSLKYRHYEFDRGGFNGGAFEVDNPLTAG